MEDVSSADLDASLKQTIAAEGIGALAFIPLVVQGQIIGKFMVYYDSPHAFAGGELNLAITIARQLGFSIERVRAERKRDLLIAELNHRVKNTLATVQSLATQTARGTDSPDAFRRAFEGRLIALSQAHDQLTRRHWKSAELRDIVEAATMPHLAGTADNVEIEGEPLTVTPRVALTLAMALHELTTNATKYGALSVPAGRIDIGWRIERQAGQPALLRIEWRERNGPPVVTPKRQGFGTRFIEGSVASELQGKAMLDYDRAGLRCTMDIPLENATPHFDADTQAAPPR
jgi:two-component sensor histidine kinase